MSARAQALVQQLPEVCADGHDVDLVIVTDDGCEILTSVTKALTVTD
jgi:hypothetical protein